MEQRTSRFMMTFHLTSVFGGVWEEDTLADFPKNVRDWSRRNTCGSLLNFLSSLG